MTDRELLEAIHTQIANHLVMPAAAQGQAQTEPAPAKLGPVFDVTLNSNGGHAEAFGVGINTFWLRNVAGGQRVDISTGDSYDLAHVTVADPAGSTVCDFTAPAGAGSGTFIAGIPGDYKITVDARDQGKINHWRA